MTPPDPRIAHVGTGDAVTTDPSVAEWLRRFDRASAALPDEQAAELRGDIVEHLRAETPGGLPDAIARLGIPEAVAAEAVATSEEQPTTDRRPAVVHPEPVHPGSRTTGSETLAVVLTLVGGVVVPVLGVPRQVVGRFRGCGKLGVRGSAVPMWTSWGRFQEMASWGRTVL